MEDNNFAISVKGYTKKFKDFVAVEDVTFNVTKGSIHGFIGPNGAGKTTTIKALIGAYSIKEGNIIVDGHKAGSIDSKKSVGYIPERASFPSDMNTLQYLRTMIELSGFSKAESTIKANDIIDKLGLGKHRRRKPKDFSSGMKKKVLIAQALVLNPSVLILDEPAANLDPTARKELFDTLRELAKNGKTIFISSHILTEMQGFIDEVTFIFQGKVKYYGDIKYDDLVDSFEVIVDELDKFIKFLDIKKYEYKIGDDKKVEIIIKDQSKFFAGLAKVKVKIISLKENSSSVEKIYNSYVKELGTESGVEGVVV